MKRRQILLWLLASVACWGSNAHGQKRNIAIRCSALLDKLDWSAEPLPVAARQFGMFHFGLFRALSAPCVSAYSDSELNEYVVAALVEVASNTILNAARREIAIKMIRNLKTDLIADESPIARAGAALGMEICRSRMRDGWADPFAPIEDSFTTWSDNGLHLIEESSPWVSLKLFTPLTVSTLKPIAPWRIVKGRVTVNDALDLNTRVGANWGAFSKYDNATLLKQFWSRHPLVTWNAYLRAQLIQCSIGPLPAARMFSILNIIMADVCVGALHWRHIFARQSFVTIDAELDRPATSAAHLGDAVADAPSLAPEDGVDRANRKVILPGIREFPALGSALSGSAAEVLTTFHLGPPPVMQVSSPNGRVIERRYATFREAAQECALASKLDSLRSLQSCIAGYEYGQLLARRALSGMNPTSSDSPLNIRYAGELRSD